MNISTPKILITGATGFIGSRLCEVLSFLGGFCPRAFVHSTASASRIARLPLEFAIGDLCDPASVERAIEGCGSVVHLARGKKPVMQKGLEIVLRAAVKHRVSRFVHVSSVAIYGNEPPPGSVAESAPAKRTDNAYGNEKLEQEQLVLRYNKRYSLPSVILRPPNVYGPYSPFTLGLIQKVRSRKLALVDGGQNPCNLVYVDNLVQALLLSLWKEEAVSQTFFVTYAETITWERCLEDTAQLLSSPLPRV
jgi:nucleoside-diphosphate-sugar epimerase